MNGTSGQGLSRPGPEYTAPGRTANVVGLQPGQETPETEQGLATETGTDASAEATATTAEQALAEPVAITADGGVPPLPGGGRGDDPDDGQAEEPSWRARRHRGLPRLRIGWHGATVEQLDRLAVTATSFGVRVGRDQAGAPALVPLFDPQPTTVALLGGRWMARLLALRALGFGATVVVFSDAPAHWHSLDAARTVVLAHGTSLDLAGSADAPVLYVHDLDELTAVVPGETPAWTSRLMVLPEITNQRASIVRDADVLLTQRLTSGQAAAVASARGLSAEQAQLAQVLHDDMLAVLTATSDRYLWVELTEAERALLGPGAASHHRAD